MRIGKIDVSTSTVIYAAVLIALAIFVPSLVMARYSAMRESWRRDTVMNSEAVGGETLEAGIATCKEMIASDPGKIPARMLLGSLLVTAKNFSEAADAFSKVQDWPAATPEEKSLALTAAGCALAQDGSTDGKPRHLDEVERMFQKALEFKDTPDALAAMALVKSWKAGPDNPAVQALVKKAFAAEPAPSPALLKELYKLNAAILTVEHKPCEASNSFASVKVLDPGNKNMDDASRVTMLAALNEPGMSPADRRAAILRTTQDIPKLGKLQIDAMLAIATAWHSLKTDADYYEPNGPFDKSLATYRSILEINSKETRAYRNYAALFEERIVKLSGELTTPINGLNGQPAPKSPWSDVAVNPVSGSETGVFASLPPADQEHLKTISNLLRDEQALWEKMLAAGALEKSDKNNAQLRYISCVRRRYMLAPWTKNLRRDENLNLVMEPADVESMKQAVKSGTELASNDETGHGSYILGLVQIEKGDLSAARGALLDAAKHGYKSDELTKLLAVLNAKTEIVDAGPAVGEREFGNAKLIRAAFQTPLGLGMLKNPKVSINGKEVPATALGSQILYIPRETEMTGGAHVVKFIASDSTGAPIDFPEFSYNVDKDPPTWSMLPKGAPVAGDVTFRISVIDPSGVDWASLSVGISSTKSATGNPYNALFIKEGHYTHALPTIKVKTDDPVIRSPFQLAAPNALPSGEYRLWIEVRDMAGNKLKDEAAFIVK